MRVVQVSGWVDPERRRPTDLLEAWPTLLDVASATARAGVDATVVQAAHENVRIERGGVRFEFIAVPEPSRLQRRCGTWAWPLPDPIADRVRASAPDIIHLHGLSFPRLAGALRAGSPTARLLVQDHADHPPPAWRAAIHRAGLAGIDAVAFTARAQATPFAPLLPEAVRIFAVPESSSRFRPGDTAEARAKSGISGEPCFVWVGHLDRNKDPMTALDAFASCVEALPSARLWMAWRKAPLLDRVRSRVESDERLAARVHLLGPQPHERIETLMRAADFVVQASHAEGSGYAIIEALACGTVPLVTDIPSFRAITDSGRFGGLSRVGDADHMAATWIEWARRDLPSLRVGLRQHFERNLSFDAIGTRLRDAYDELVRS